MFRAVKISLSAATQAKQGRLNALRREIRSCTQAYIDSLWINPGRLDSETLGRVSGGSLSCRHRSNCLKTALETVITTRKAAKATGKIVRKPLIRNAIRLSSLVANIEPGRGSFDYVLKISGLSLGNRIVVPFKSHARLNHWLSQPGAKLLDGCVLGDGWAGLYIELPDRKPKNGPVLGVDIGVNKLLVDSNGQRYGEEIKQVCARVRRCKPKSNGKGRAIRARRDYINRTVKSLPWAKIGTIGIEDLTGLKTGKRKGRGKSFRKALAPWTFRQVVTRIEQLAQENRVCLVSVDPKNTSRTCPRCQGIAKENRVGENFRCVNCNFTADADYVGALNVLARTTGNSRQPIVAW